MLGNIVNLRTSDAVGAGSGYPLASGSRPGEDNSKHVALAIVAVGAIVLISGIINVRIGAAIGRG